MKIWFKNYIHNYLSVSLWMLVLDILAFFTMEANIKWLGVLFFTAIILFTVIYSVYEHLNRK